MKPLNTWSPLSNVTVSPKRSKDYQKLLILLYGFVVAALFQSNFYWWFDVGLLIGFGAHFVSLWRLETPAASCKRLQYLEQKWWVYDVTHSCDVYSSVRIRFDFGWLLSLVFERQLDTKKMTRKHILLFRDQLTQDEHRLLRVLLRVCGRGVFFKD